jgi:hypothetical protein
MPLCPDALLLQAKSPEFAVCAAEYRRRSLQLAMAGLRGPILGQAGLGATSYKFGTEIFALGWFGHFQSWRGFFFF